MRSGSDVSGSIVKDVKATATTVKKKGSAERLQWEIVGRIDELLGELGAALKELDDRLAALPVDAGADAVKVGVVRRWPSVRRT